MSKSVIPILFFIILVLSCKIDLKEKERNWNPYVKNEVLVFESSKKQLDTIVINEIIDNVVSASPAPKLYRHTSLIVYGKRLSLKDNKFSQNSILEISSSTPQKNARIGFGLRLNNANFGGSYEINKLEKYPTMSITTKAGTFNDVIKLKPDVYYSKRKDEVQFMYWSKKNGYIKFERADGFTWELKKKYVP